MKTLSRSRLVLPSMICLVFACSCERSKKVTPESEKKLVEKEIGYGKLVGNTYTNDYFNLKVTIREGWHISSEAENDETREIGNEYMKRDMNSPEMKVAKARSVNMITAFRRSPEKVTEDYNYSIAILAGNIRGQKHHIKNAEIFLEVLKKQLLSTKLQHFSHEIESGFKIGSIPAYRMKVISQIEGISVSQYYYSTVVRDYVLSIIITYTSPESLKELEAILNSIEASF